VLSLGAGIDQINLDQLPEAVPIARLVDDSLTRTMTEYAKAAVYRYHRRLHIFEQHSRERIWEFIEPKAACETAVGVLGLGEVGSNIATALQRDGFKVYGWSRSVKSLEMIDTYGGRDGLLSMVGQCEIIVNVLPLTADTRHILARDLFAHFAPGTCLVNMGRGQHVVDADLLEAIDLGHVEAATLDVTALEPLPISHPFWNHPAILITPHVAGLCAPMRAVRTIAANIRRAMAREPLQHQVNLERGY